MNHHLADQQRIARLGVVPLLSCPRAIRAAGKAGQTAPGTWRVEVTRLQAEMLAHSFARSASIVAALPARHPMEVRGAIMRLHERPNARVFIVNGNAELETLTAAVEASVWVRHIAEEFGAPAAAAHRISLRELAEKMRHIVGRKVQAGVE